MPIHYRNADVEGLTVFYREAGDPAAPAVVLLHGAPTSSIMYRNLIPLLADRFHVIAPDLIAYGHSSTPTVGEFSYNFDSLTLYVNGLLEQLGLERYAMYVQDYGAPVGWRLALNHPERITAIVTQNGSGYEDGFDDAFWGPAWLHEYFRDSQVPLLAVWGKNDLIFVHPGATAFGRDLPDAEIHLLDGGHFLLESHLDEAGALIRDFLSRTLLSAPRWRREIAGNVSFARQGQSF